MTPNSTLCLPGTGLADRLCRMPRSGIRELLSGARKLISFGGGVPHDSCIPCEAINTAFEMVMTKYGTRAFGYGATEGEWCLREYVARWLTRLGIEASTEQVMIVNGSQQALDLLGKVFVDEGSPVLIERPTYLAALQALSAFGPHYHEVEMDGDGAMPDSVEAAVTGCRFFYTIPSFQNPSGVCCTLERRLRIVESVNRAGTVLVEDDPYSRLYYEDQPPPPLCACGADRAVYLGTFSKLLAPGFRLGWIWTGFPLMEHLITVKQASDLCTGVLGQLLLHETLNLIDLDTHLSFVRQVYRRQRDTMARLMTMYLPESVQWSIPRGGMFFWARLATGLTARELLGRSLKRGVAFGDGAAFFASSGGEQFLRLNFTQLSEQQMEEGVRILSECMADG